MLPFYLAIFLLFFAVLAAAYFYLQRAKARDAAPAEASASAGEPAAASVPSAVEDSTDLAKAPSSEG